MAKRRSNALVVRTTRFQCTSGFWHVLILAMQEMKGPFLEYKTDTVLGIIKIVPALGEIQR